MAHPISKSAPHQPSAPRIPAIAGKRAEVEKERRRKDADEKRLKELKATADKRTADIRGKQVQVTAGLENTSKTEQLLREQKQHTDKTLKEVDGLTANVGKLQGELADQNTQNASLDAENVEREKELKSAYAAIVTIQAETGRMQKLRDSTNKRVASLDKQKAEADQQREELKLAVANMEGDIEAERREREVERKVHSPPHPYNPLPLSKPHPPYHFRSSIPHPPPPIQPLPSSRPSSLV